MQKISLWGEIFIKKKEVKSNMPPRTNQNRVRNPIISKKPIPVNTVRAWAAGGQIGNVDPKMVQRYLRAIAKRDHVKLRE